MFPSVADHAVIGVLHVLLVDEVEVEVSWAGSGEDVFGEATGDAVAVMVEVLVELAELWFEVGAIFYGPVGGVVTHDVLHSIGVLGDGNDHYLLL